MNEYSIGVDLGGTNLRAAAIDQSGKMLDKIAVDTNLAAGPDAVLSHMVEAIKELRDRFGQEFFAAFPGENEQPRNRSTVNARDPLRAPNAVSFEQKPGRQNRLVLGDVHRVQSLPVRFGVGPFAPRAAEPSQSISVFSVALANHVARLASHCFRGCCRVNHGLNIQLSLVVCQEKNEKFSPIFPYFFSPVFPYLVPRFGGLLLVVL